MQAILHDIRHNDIASEDGKLPSEARLGERFGVSRATVREALSILEQRGIVIRRHGIGTFVVSVPDLAQFNIGQAEKLSVVAQESGLDWRCADVTVEERRSSIDEASALRISSGSKVLSYERVILIENEHVAHMTDVVPLPVLEKEDLGDPPPLSVWDVLRDKDESVLSHAMTDLTVETAPSSISSKLGLEPSTALLKLESRVVTVNASLVDYTVAYFIPGRFRFHLIRPIEQIGGLSATFAAQATGSGG